MASISVYMRGRAAHDRVVPRLWSPGPVAGERLAAAPAQRFALPIAASAGLLTVLVLQVLHHLVSGTGSDFRAVLRGGSDLAGGRDIYAPALHFLRAGHLRHILTMPVTPYVYPPLLAAAVRPLIWLPPWLAQLCWDCVNAAALTALFVLVVRLSGARRWRDLFLAGSLYCYFPLDMGLGTGQIDLPLTVLALIGFLLYRARYPRAAGLALAGITLIKPTLGVLILFYIARRAWTTVLSFGTGLAAGCAASLALVGAPVFWEYRKVAAGWAGAFGILPLNQSLHGLALRLLAPALDTPPGGAGATLSLLIEVALMATGAALAWHLLRGGEPVERMTGILQFYAAFAVLLLGLPFTENIHLVWLLPGLALLLLRGRHGPWQACVLGAYILLALPFAELIAWRAGPSLAGRLASGAECYGLLLLAAALCAAAFAKGERDAERGMWVGAIISRSMMGQTRTG